MWHQTPKKIIVSIEDDGDSNTPLVPLDHFYSITLQADAVFDNDDNGLVADEQGVTTSQVDLASPRLNYDPNAASTGNSLLYFSQSEKFYLYFSEDLNKNFIRESGFDLRKEDGSALNFTYNVSHASGEFFGQTVILEVVSGTVSAGDYQMFVAAGSVQDLDGNTNKTDLFSEIYTITPEALSLEEEGLLMGVQTESEGYFSL